MSDILKQAQLVNRVVFDPNNMAHVESFIVFLRTGNWGAVQFFPEVPYIEVPMTVMMKFACNALGVKPESPMERAARLDAAAGLVRFPKSNTEAERAERLATANKLMQNLLAA